MEREIEDIAAVMDVVGGHGTLFGHSSSAALVLRAADALGDRVTDLILYEAPHNEAPEARAAFSMYTQELNIALAQGRRGGCAFHRSAPAR